MSVKLHTKQDLLKYVHEHNACITAIQWVEASPRKSAKAIWNSCGNTTWLFWLGYEWNSALADQFFEWIIRNYKKPEYQSEERMQRRIDTYRYVRGAHSKSGVFDVIFYDYNPVDRCAIHKKLQSMW